MRKPRILLLPNDDDAPAFYRLLEPYSELSPVMPEVDFHREYAVGVVDLDHLQRAILWSDIVISQRAMFSIHVGLLQFARAYGKTIVLDFDDALMDIPRESPVYGGWGPNTPAYQWLLKALALADYLHVSTPELAESFRPYTRAPISVFLNALPVGHPKYAEDRRRRRELPADRVVVMWHGTPCHHATFQFLNSMVGAICRARPQILFALATTRTEWFDQIRVPDAQKVIVGGHEIRRFAGVPSLADIHLTPIRRAGAFENGKSELKVLQAAVWGLPSISSPTAPYLRFHGVSGGANVIARTNGVDEWRAAVLDLVDDAAKRRRLGEQARQAVTQHYSLAAINEGRRKFLFELCGLRAPLDTPRPSAEPCAAK